VVNKEAAVNYFFTWACKATGVYVMIRGEVRPDPDGKLRLIIYDEVAMQDMVKSMVGMDIIKGGKVICKVSRAEIIDGKILWEAE
jgi:hypothetical protein